MVVAARRTKRRRRRRSAREEPRVGVLGEPPELLLDPLAVWSAAQRRASRVATRAAVAATSPRAEERDEQRRSARARTWRRGNATTSPANSRRGISGDAKEQQKHAHVRVARQSPCEGWKAGRADSWVRPPASSTPRPASAVSRAHALSTQDVARAPPGVARARAPRSRRATATAAAQRPRRRTRLDDAERGERALHRLAELPPPTVRDDGGGRERGRELAELARRAAPPHLRKQPRLPKGAGRAITGGRARAVVRRSRVRWAS